MDLGGVFATACADDRRGATEIERRLIRALLAHRGVWTAEELARGAVAVCAGSAMANLHSLAEKLRSTADLDRVEAALRARADTLDRLDSLLAAAASELVAAVATVVTISRSSAVAAVLEGAARGGWRGRVAVLDGTPAGRGIDQARRLEEQGLDVASLPDGAVLEVLSGASDGCLVLTGADALGSRRFLNAQGTGLLCECAARRSITTAVVADSGKEVREAVIDGLLAAGRRHDESGPGRNWPVLEAVATQLVSRWISERGVEALPPLRQRTC